MKTIFMLFISAVFVVYSIYQFMNRLEAKKKYCQTIIIYCTWYCDSYLNFTENLTFLNLYSKLFLLFLIFQKNCFY